MCPTARDDPRSLERFRPYLHLLARLRLQGEQRRRIDPCDMVQQTLFEASQQRDRLNNSSPAEMASWLRRLLAQNLGQAVRALHREDDTLLDAARPAARAVPEQNQVKEPQDPSIAVAEALLKLPEAEREALVLQYWHGLSLADIGERLSRSPAGVAGLIKRGLSRLRDVRREPA